MASRAAIITPRLLTRQQAASYCGVSVDTFNATCPVAAIAVGHGRRLERYDMVDLDEWIERMKRGAVPAKRSIADLLCG